MNFDLAAIIANVSLLAICTHLLSFRALAGTDEALRFQARLKGTALAAAAAALCSLTSADPEGFGVDGRLGVIYAGMLLVGARAALVIALSAGATAWAVGTSNPLDWLIVTGGFLLLSWGLVWRIEGGARSAPIVRTWILFPAGAVLLSVMPVIILRMHDQPVEMMMICAMALMLITVVSLSLFRASMFWGLTAASRLIQLENINAQIEEAARVKTDFLNALSHSLRTPLHGMYGLVELVAADLPNGPAKSNLRKAELLGRQLNHMISTGLRFVEVDNVTMMVEEKRFTLDQMRRKSLAEFEVATRRHGVALSVVCVGRPDHADALLSGYQDVLEETTVLVLRYFLQGAPPRQIHVTLGLERTEEGQTFAVVTGSDAAAPLSDAAQPMPELGSAQHPHQPEVMNLSLAVAERLATLAGGQLTGLFEPGNGHHFTYKLPITVVV